MSSSNQSEWVSQGENGTQNYNNEATTKASSSSSAGVNPWENAANDATWSQSSFSMDPTTNDAVNTSSYSSPSSPARESQSKVSQCLYYSWILCHLCDVLFAGFWIWYAVVGIQSHQAYSSEQQHEDDDNIISNLDNVPLVWYILMLTLAGLYLTRTIIVIMLNTSCCCHDQSSTALVWSSQISLLVLFIYISLIITIFGFHMTNSILRHYPDLFGKLHSFIAHHPKSIWITIAALCGVELLRYVITMQYSFILQQRQQQVGTATDRSVASIGATAFRTTPWWWQNNNYNNNNGNMRAPLLSNNYNTSTEPPEWTSHEQRNRYVESSPPGGWSSGWSLFGNRRSSNNNNIGDDNASVDFASIHEDWASRSQENPIWWADEST